MHRDLTAAEALSTDDFDALMQPFAPWPEDGRVALAVSGGPDSMALAFCVKRWSDRNGTPPPLALIVDHSLRAESAVEAETVRQRLEAQAIPAEILRWEHAPVASRLHSEARKARYRLLIDACRRHKLSALLFAHQREDQAETVLMRFAKGTGLDGLAGIPAQSAMEGVRILRPFLMVPKERLIATCIAANISFVTDPSNGLEKFARGRLRRVMPLLAEEGLTVERLIDCAARAAEARDALDLYTSEFLAASSRQDMFGVISIDTAELLAVPRAIARRAIALALQAVHAEDYAPQHASLSLLLDALKGNAIMPPRTLNGCLIGGNERQVTMMREYSGITETATIRASESIIWDGRWRMSLVSDAEPAIYTVQALGNPPHELLDRLAPGLRHKVPQGRVRATLPALWRDDEIAIIPSFDQNGEIRAELLGLWPPRRKN